MNTMWPLIDLVRRSRAARPAGAARRRSCRPAVERLEDRWLLAAAAISAIEQYGIPSVFAIGGSGISRTTFSDTGHGQAGLEWLDPDRGGVDAQAISPGTVLVSGVLRPNMFAFEHGGQYRLQRSK